jgi:hypothetical protein
MEGTWSHPTLWLAVYFPSFMPKVYQLKALVLIEGHCCQQRD